MTEIAAPAGGSFLVTEPDGQILTPELLGAEARMLADATADFMRREVLPAADRLQSQEPDLMAALLRKAGQAGLLGIEIPEKYGGIALAKSVSARIAEAIAVEPSFAVSHNVHTSVATLPIVFFGTEEQKQRWLPKLASGEWIGAYALSESHAGSDALAARTRAVPSPDGRSYRLTGEKMWITNAAFADLFVVFAKIEGQEKLSAFVVERGMAGVSIGREEHKLGLKGSSTCRLILDGVAVPAANLVGEPGEGVKVALYTLNLGRFKIAASSVGQSKNLLGIATRYAKERKAFGKPISEFGLIQQKLAHMAARIFACESMVYRVAGYLDAAFEATNDERRTTNEGEPQASRLTGHPSEEYAIECALLKVACTETLDYCADECLQIHGGYGYTEEYPAARAWRDARVNRIYEGTNEINRLTAVSMLLKRIDSGRIDLKYGPEASGETGVDGNLRSIILASLSMAREHYADPSQEQEFCAAFADMLIALLADESMSLRARQIVERGGSERKYISAFAARRIVLNQSLPYLQASTGTILASCGRAENGIDIATPRRLAQAVIEAGGYIW